MLLAGIGACIAFRDVRIGIALGGAVLAIAAGFGTAKLRTDFVRAPVLAKELRYVEPKGWVESHELRDKKRIRLTLRVIALAEVPPDGNRVRQCHRP
ncbi:MAG: hypothetical protein ACR2J1_00440 [Methyloceanibacter sp.]|uniref:hypothetical protein n=1 Tax=Methyloceanibacter sp. TaxID=1965321 RepID=UPI003D9BB76D